MAGIPIIEPYALPTPGELPENTAKWCIDPGRAALLVHDMQRYFVRFLPASLRDELVRNIALLQDRCRTHRIPVAYTAQPGDMSDSQRGLLKDFWGPGMRASDSDRQIVEPLVPGPDDRIFTKWRYSAFLHTDLLARLRESRRDQLILCGVYAHVGVLATAIEAFSHDIEVFLVADAIADFSADYHRLAVTYAAERCAVVITAKEVLA
ncbi:MAG TPA: isochorismatase family protein [Micromonosporaceae bacterium]